MSKYGIKAVTVDGVRFDSAGEHRRWCELQLLERAGQITRLERQVKLPLVVDGKPVLIRSKGFPNGRKAVYHADFAYFENGVRIVEEHKGFDTDISRLRRAVVEAIYGVRIRITGACDYRSPKRRARSIAAGDAA